MNHESREHNAMSEFPSEIELLHVVKSIPGSSMALSASFGSPIQGEIRDLTAAATEEIGNETLGIVNWG